MNLAESTPHKRSPDFLGIDRNVAAASAATFLPGLGEELWRKFLPKYLESLGASVAVVGLFGTAEDFLDGCYQYPGGWLADRWGRRSAFLTFLAAAVAGYLVYLFSPSWPFLFLGLALVTVWQCMASPAIFAVIGDALPKERRAMGFTIQSIVKRVPMVVSPLLGGIIIGRLGIAGGMRAGLLVTLVLAGATIPLLLSLNLPVGARDRIRIGGVWNSFPAALRSLLASDITIRTCEGLVDVFIILYVTNIAGVTIPQYGALVAVQLATSIFVYVPSARIADRYGRKPVIIATFFFFAMFPAAVVAASSLRWMILAFVVGGLRELGEPARKAMIVDFAEPQVRARAIGLYYFVRSISVAPASAIGGLLWGIHPWVPFLAASLIGICGTLLFAATVKEEYAH